MSSRNVYLSPEERARAPELHRVMQAVASRVRDGEAAPGALAWGRDAIGQKGLVVDYLELRDAASLGEPRPGLPRRLLAAARLGSTRLIDNIAV
jgi:pantoate--beta-alanine ligase